uniref:Uncharacterized protein n=1 Tax=Romanomermis culicivorax TaxID=13658 RepID=A0A915KLA3_ROMCU
MISINTEKQTKTGHQSETGVKAAICKNKELKDKLAKKRAKRIQCQSTVAPLMMFSDVKEMQGGWNTSRRLYYLTGNVSTLISSEPRHI